MRLIQARLTGDWLGWLIGWVPLVAGPVWGISKVQAGQQLALIAAYAQPITASRQAQCKSIHRGESPCYGVLCSIMILPRLLCIYHLCFSIIVITITKNGLEHLFSRPLPLQSLVPARVKNNTPLRPSTLFW